MQAIVVYICRDMFLCRGIDTFLFSLLSSSINYMMIRLLNGLRIIICLKSEFNNSRNGVWFTHTQKKKEFCTEVLHIQSSSATNIENLCDYSLCFSYTKSWFRFCISSLLWLRLNQLPIVANLHIVFIDLDGYDSCWGDFSFLWIFWLYV